MRWWCILHSLHGFRICYTIILLKFTDKKNKLLTDRLTNTPYCRDEQVPVRTMMRPGSRLMVAEERRMRKRWWWWGCVVVADSNDGLHEAKGCVIYGILV